MGDVRVSQRAPQHPSFALRQLGIVVDRIHAFDDLNRGLLLGASSGGFGIGNPFNSREQMFSYLLLVRTDRELEVDFVRDDVVLSAAVDGSHRDDGWILRIDFARHDGLPGQDGAGGHHNRIDGPLWRCAMASLAEDGHVYAV